MMLRILLLTTLSLAVASTGCTPPPPLSGRIWHPIVNNEEVRGPGAGLTLALPGQPDTGAPIEGVDPESSLIVGLHYEACHWADPRLTGIADDRIGVQLTELNRLCVRPMPRVAWFALPWSELPAQFVLVDRDGSETQLQDRRRV